MECYESVILKVGAHPKVVQERLGHSSIQMTIDTYSHVAPGIQEAVAKRFDEAINQIVISKILKTNPLSG